MPRNSSKFNPSTPSNSFSLRQAENQQWNLKSNYGQFHRKNKNSSTFYEQILHQYFGAKKFQSQTVTREKLLKTLLYEKVERKALMKLTSVRSPTSKHN